MGAHKRRRTLEGMSMAWLSHILGTVPEEAAEPMVARLGTQDLRTRRKGLLMFDFTN